MFKGITKIHKQHKNGHLLAYIHDLTYVLKISWLLDHSCLACYSTIIFYLINLNFTHMLE